MSCEQCTQGYVMAGEPKGKMVDGAYLHESPSGSKTRAVIFLTDVFGLPLVNCKLMADQFSEKLDCDVWVPDLFNGRPPFKAEELEPLMPDRAGEKMSAWNVIRFIFLALGRIHLMWGIRPANVDNPVDAFIQKVKLEQKYEKIGAVGYCYGGALAIRLGSRSSLPLDSIVIAHPGSTSIKEIQAIRIPASWACAEDDMSFKKPLRDQAEAAFAARKDKPDFVEYEFRDYKGTAHGFAARPNLGLPEIVEAYNGAFQQTIDWFNKTL